MARYETDGGDHPDAHTIEPAEEPGIFDHIIGHDGAKAVLRAALRKGGVNVALVGPPAHGKSEMLRAIDEHVAGASYHDTRGFTESKLRDTFLLDPEILLLDELDKAKPGAYEAMTMPMEDGIVTKDTQREAYSEEVDVQVIAALNDADRLPDHTLSRFRAIPLEEYDPDQYMMVCARMLPEVVDWMDDAEDARLVAQVAHDAMGTTDPRDARDAALLAESVEETWDIARAMVDPSTGVESAPLTPSELDRRRNASDGAFNQPTESIREWSQKSCSHIRGEEVAYRAGRYRCPDCAAAQGVSTDTPMPNSSEE